MNKKQVLIIGSSLVLLFLLPILVSAQTLRDQKRDTRQDIQQKRQDMRQDVTDKRQNMMQDIRQKRDAMKTEMMEKKGKLTEEMREKRETMRSEIRDKRETFHEEVKGMREEFREKAQERREELKKKLGEKRAERIEAFFDRMLKKFENALDRLNNFAERIGARLDKAEVNGKDVTELRTKLDTAETAIDDAQNALEDAKAQYATAVSDPNFKKSFAKVRELVRGVAEKVKVAHRAVVDVVRSTKGLGGGNATSAEPYIKSLTARTVTNGTNSTSARCATFT